MAAACTSAASGGDHADDALADAAPLEETAGSKAADSSAETAAAAALAAAAVEVENGWAAAVVAARRKWTSAAAVAPTATAAATTANAAGGRGVAPESSVDTRAAAAAIPEAWRNATSTARTVVDAAAAEPASVVAPDAVANATAPDAAAPASAATGLAPGGGGGCGARKRMVCISPPTPLLRPPHGHAVHQRVVPRQHNQHHGQGQQLSPGRLEQDSVGHFGDVRADNRGRTVARGNGGGDGGRGDSSRGADRAVINSNRTGIPRAVGYTDEYSSHGKATPSGVMGEGGGAAGCTSGGRADGADAPRSSSRAYRSGSGGGGRGGTVLTCRPSCCMCLGGLTPVLQRGALPPDVNWFAAMECPADQHLRVPPCTTPRVEHPFVMTGVVENVPVWESLPDHVCALVSSTLGVDGLLALIALDADNLSCLLRELPERLSPAFGVLVAAKARGVASLFGKRALKGDVPVPRPLLRQAKDGRLGWTLRPTTRTRRTLPSPSPSAGSTRCSTRGRASGWCLATGACQPTPGDPLRAATACGFAARTAIPSATS